VELYLHSPNTPSWRGIQSTGTALPYLFLIMCHVPSTAAFVENLLNAFLVLLIDIFNHLVTIPVATMMMMMMMMIIIIIIMPSLNSKEMNIQTIRL
jgi:hypothetical protein